MVRIFWLTMVVFTSIMLGYGAARAETVVIDVDERFTVMDYHTGTVEIDSNNASLPIPANPFTSSRNSTAQASMSASAGEAGVATASVGLNVEWDTGDKTWEEVKDIPVEVRISFRYSINANWTQRTGSSNAGVSVNRLQSGWYDFVGHRVQIDEPHRELAIVSYGTTPDQIGDRIWLTAYTQAHVSRNLTNTNDSFASVEINYIQFRWRPPEPDMEAVDLEVTQAIQDLNNSVRLVAGKRTFVRLHARSTTTNFYRTTASLFVESPAGNVRLLPVNPGREILVRPGPLRERREHAFLFELPTAVTTGTVRLTGEVNPSLGLITRDPEERFYGNNTQTLQVQFEAVPPIHVVFYQIGYEAASRQWTTPFSHVRDTVSWLETAYPISTINFRSRTYSYSPYFGSSVPTCVKINSDLSSKRWWDGVFGRIGFGAPGDTGARYYGLVDDRGFEAVVRGLSTLKGANYFMRGCSVNIPALIGSGPAGVPRVVRMPNPDKPGENTRLPYFTWDTDTSYADWYAGHELGHTHGRRHPGYCQKQARDAKHESGDHPLGRISTMAIGDGALYGFDSRSRRLYNPANWFDVMTYCPNQWISDYTYEGLMSYFQTSPVAAARIQSQDMTAQPADRLFITGLIEPDSKEVQLDPIFLVPDVASATDPVPGPYEIVLRDGTGSELATYPFTPLSLNHGPPSPGLTDEEIATLLINEAVLFVTGTVQVDIQAEGTTLASVNPGGAMPTVTLSSPNGGEIVSGNSADVSWLGSDPDGDDLVYHLQYSPDDGQTWEMLAQFLTATSITISKTNLIASDEGRLRVWATDGLNTVSDTSDGTFTVTNQLPEVAIVSPISGTSVVISETVSFRASAYDPDTGSMDGAQLTWFSNVDGVLGTGAQLSVSDLSVSNLFFGEEKHTISLHADDGSGQTVVKTVDLVVVTKPEMLPAVPHKLLAGPAPVTLDASQGLTNSVVYVDNENPAGYLGWQAETSEPWIQLSSDSGETPGQFRVSSDSSGLTSGVYTGTITLTSPDVPDTIRVPISLTLDEDVPIIRGVYLPFLTQK